VSYLTAPVVPQKRRRNAGEKEAFEARTRELVRRWERQRRERFRRILLSDPMPSLEDLPIGELVVLCPRRMP
jgi:hypothetical protein